MVTGTPVYETPATFVSLALVTERTGGTSPRVRRVADSGGRAVPVRGTGSRRNVLTAMGRATSGRTPSGQTRTTIC